MDREQAPGVNNGLIAFTFVQNDFTKRGRLPYIGLDLVFDDHSVECG